jgi:oligosaccharide repeat unit polymerase
MITTFTIILFGFSMLFGLRLFKRWYNPISIYAVMWAIEIVLYQLRLMRYPDIMGLTWMYIGGGFFSFLAGISIFFFGKRLSDDRPVNDPENTVVTDERWVRKKPLLNAIILLTGIIGILGAIQHWQVLIRQFGSIGEILLNAPKIYRMRVEGEIHGLLPYVTSLLNVSIFFAGVYTGRYGLIAPGSFLAFTGVVIEDMANFGREGMLFAFCEFVAVVLVFQIRSVDSDERKKIKKRQMISLASVFLIVLTFATIIKSLRSGKENLRGASRGLNKYDTGTVITPSIYLYFSSQIGVFNQYLLKEEESVSWGENTFLPIYNILSKFGIVERPSNYQRGYYVPVWTNTGTYLRELHADFGVLGIFIIPFLLGLFISFLWIRYKLTNRISDLVILVYLLIVIHFTFLMIITRSAKWWISSTLILIIVYFLNRRREPAARVAIGSPKAV